MTEADRAAVVFKAPVAEPVWNARYRLFEGGASHEAGMHETGSPCWLGIVQATAYNPFSDFVTLAPA